MTAIKDNTTASVLTSSSLSCISLLFDLPRFLGAENVLPPSQRECQDLAEFVRKVLGPYSINITTAARLCSASLCQGKGRCVRQNPKSSAYLHLPTPFEVMGKATEKVSE